MAGPAILLEELSKSFESLKALDSVSFEVPEGSVFAVVGPEGAGKSSLLKVLATILRPNAGVAKVGGYDVVDEAGDVRRIVGISTEPPALDHLLSGWDNLFILGRLLGLSRRDARARADELVEAYGLEHEAPYVVATYSKGVRRLLDLAAAVLGDPQVLLLDEPAKDLDGDTGQPIWASVAQLAEEGRTVLFTTADLQEATRQADGLVVLDHGRIISASTPEELADRFGRHVIEVMPEDPQDIDAVRRILLGFAMEDASANIDLGVVSVPIPESAAFWGAVKKLETRRVQVAHIALRSLNLDDIFLMITGHVAQDEPAETDPEDGE